MLVPSFKNGNYDATRNYFDKYYMLLVENKSFNALIDKKKHFWLSFKKLTRSACKAYKNVKK